MHEKKKDQTNLKKFRITFGSAFTAHDQHVDGRAFPLAEMTCRQHGLSTRLVETGLYRVSAPVDYTALLSVVTRLYKALHAETQKEASDPQRLALTQKNEQLAVTAGERPSFFVLRSFLHFCMQTDRLTLGLGG